MNFYKNNIMFKTQRSPIVIALRDSYLIKEEKENNQTFYGRFYIGPFEIGQSLTMANALRRSLLSEVPGLGLTSVEIEGVAHEYSTIPGVQETVFDILLNLKNIVFKPTTYLKKADIGYCNARGPKILRAKDLLLPVNIQCVNPDQYLATLKRDGTLNMKFKIRQGTHYLVNTPFEQLELSVAKQEKSSDQKKKNGQSMLKQNKSDLEGKLQVFSETLKTKKNENKAFSNVLNIQKEKSLFVPTRKSKPLLLDPVFMPVTKANYVLELDERVHNSPKELIVLEIWTNGSISPHEALQTAIKKLVRLLGNVKNAKMLK
uniref:alpha subunit of RNA polymerase n=1 Tax=Gormaniella terricola TaxID=2904618 RepID=UPI0021CCF44D|nr:alpha subunit of RNA polymerase [Gormaniella terricola]UWV18305.1 alpha subunit of RNA polymerase [Gormaniella terricola]